MKINKLKIISAILFCISSISAYSQLICELGNRTTVVTNNAVIYENEGFELSALAYYPYQNGHLFFMPLDDAQRDNQYQSTRIRAYDSNTGNSFSVSLEGSFNDFDFEGLTWLEQDYFVLVEEKENEIYFLQYSENNKKFTVLGRHSTGIPFVQIGNDEDGLEGISYNPHIKTLYLVSEMDYKMYSIPIALPQASNNNEGALLLAQTSSIQLPFSTGACASGIFHLGLNVTANHPLSNNILVLSDELRKVFEFKLTLNANNQLTNNSLMLINDFSLNSQPQPEGVVVVGNNLYIASELPNGGLSSYAIKTENDSCNDGNNATINDQYDANCNCIGDIPGCTDAQACNYEAAATFNNGSCIYVTDPNYNCAGVCVVAFDCNGNCGGTAIAGAACNDGNPDTANDTYNGNCECEGQLICQPNVVINTNNNGITTNGISLQNLYESSQLIETEVVTPNDIDVIIRDQESVDLKSNHITLNEGFTVLIGGCLNAEIEPCQ